MEEISYEEEATKAILDFFEKKFHKEKEIQIKR